MRHTTSVRCTLCNSIMVFVQKRGSANGMFICPVCAEQKRLTSLAAADEREEIAGDMRYRPEERHSGRMHT